MSMSLYAGDIDLSLVPPSTVSDKVDLDIRAGFLNGKSHAVRCRYSLVLDGEGGSVRLAKGRIRMDGGGSSVVREKMPTAGLSGCYQVELRVRRGFRTMVERRPIEVLSSEERSTGTIDGAFAGLYHWSEVEGSHWNAALKTFTADDWRGVVQSMHAAGMDIVVIQELFRENGGAYYPSELFDGSRVDIACDDPVEAIMDEADRLGMYVFPGIGLYTWFDFGEESLEWHKKVTEEVYGRYGHHRSFYGFYVSEESGGSLDKWEATAEGREMRQKEIVHFFEEYSSFCRGIAPGKPIMLATNSMGIAPRHDTYMELLRNLDILCPFGFARMPGDDLSGHEAAGLLQAWCDEAGAHLWFDLEAFLFNEDGSLYPRDFEGIKGDLLMFGNFEKILCYQYPGVFNNPDLHQMAGDPGSIDLYREYETYYREVSNSLRKRMSFSK